MSKVYLAVGNTDMRKAINGLSILVEQAMDLNPFSEDLFVFYNRQRTIIKILYWDLNGFALWLKMDLFTHKQVIMIGDRQRPIQLL